MGIYPRQIVAGVLTVTMFVMLGKMIKRDHFDAPISHVNHAESTQRFDDNNDSEQSFALGNGGDGPWKEESGGLKRCWSKPDLDESEESKGFVTFSLTNGPEYHVSQVSRLPTVPGFEVDIILSSPVGIEAWSIEQQFEVVVFIPAGLDALFK